MLFHKIYYMGLAQQIKEKSKARTAFVKEKKELPVIRVLRSRELAAQIAELTENLEELRSEKARLLECFSYEDASAPAAFRREIAAMENSLKKLTVQEKKYSGELEKASRNTGISRHSQRMLTLWSFIMCGSRFARNTSGVHSSGIRKFVVKSQP